MKIVIELILFAVIVLVGFVVYKLISREMKKSLEAQTKVLNECKTEEEREAALKLLKRKNIKKSNYQFSLFFFYCAANSCLTVNVINQKNSSCGNQTSWFV